MIVAVVEFFRKAWVTIVAVGAAVLFGAFKLITYQRDKARRERDIAKRRADAEEALRDTERRVGGVVASKREEAKDNAKTKLRERRAGDTPTGNVGDRLHNDQD